MSSLFNLSLMPSPWESLPISSSPAPPASSLPSGESEPAVMPAWGAGEAISPPPGYVLIPQADIDQMLALIATLQTEREADRIDHADYERLREKERVELLVPFPVFMGLDK